MLPFFFSFSCLALHLFERKVKNGAASEANHRDHNLKPRRKEQKRSCVEKSVSQKSSFSGEDEPISLKKKLENYLPPFASEWPSIYPLSSIDSTLCPVRQETACVNQILRLEIQILFPALQDLGAHAHVAETG